MTRVFLLISVFCYAGLGVGFVSEPVHAEEQMTAKELERWFNDDSEQRASEVNEGELVFLDKLPQKNVTHSKNHFTISPASLQHGWVTLKQCYDELDAVPAVQVVYQYKQMRKLAVTLSSGIDKTWIEGQSVQMEGVQKGARLCVSAEVHIFYKNKDGTYSLVNGPYRRKFLDGYYPMQVTLDVSYPDSVMQLLSTRPVKGKGVKITTTPGHAKLNAIFEGELLTEFRFKVK